MSVIKRLIIGEWLRFLLTSFISLFLLLTTGNLINGFMRTNVSGMDVILNYLLQIPNFIIQVLPVSCLIASLFSINKLKSRNELTAIFASGYSRQSFVLALIYVSIFVSSFQFVTSAFIGPYVSSKKLDVLSDSVDKFRNLKSKGLTSTISSGEIWYKSGNYYFSFSHFDGKDSSINNVIIYTYDNEYRLEKINSISKLIYNSKTLAWDTPAYIEISNLNTKSFPSLEVIDQKLILNEKISDFEKIESDITTLNFFNLYQYIIQLKKSGINSNEYFVIFLRHISDSLICVIFTLLAAISIFNPNRRNSSFGKSASFVFVFTLGYWLIQAYFIELGMNLKLNPFIACFAIPIFFVLFILSVFFHNRKLA